MVENNINIDFTDIQYKQSPVLDKAKRKESDLSKYFPKKGIALPSINYVLGIKEVLSDLKQKYFASRLSYLEKELLGPRGSYDQAGLRHLEQKVWGPQGGHPADDQALEAHVFELASLLILNRQIKSTLLLERKWDALIKLLEKKKLQGGFLSGKYGNLRLAALKLYKLTYDNQNKENNTIDPKKFTEAIGECEKITKPAGKRFNPITDLEKHASMEAYFRIGDAYKLLVTNLKSDKMRRVGLVEKMNEYADLGGDIFADHESNDLLLKQGEITKKSADLAQQPWTKDFKTFLMKFYEDFGWKASVNYLRTVSKNVTKYLYNVDINGVTLWSPPNSVTSKQEQDIFRFKLDLQYTVQDWLMLGVNGSLDVANMKNKFTKQATQYGGTPANFSYFKYSLSANEPYKITGYTYGGYGKFTPIRNKELHKNAPYIKEISSTIYYNHDSSKQYFDAGLTKQLQYPVPWREADVFGVRAFLNTSFTRKASDWHNLTFEVDAKQIKEQVTKNKGTYNVKTWNGAALRYDNFDYTWLEANQRNFWNVTFRTNANFSFRYISFGLGYEFNLYPENQYDWSATALGPYKKEHIYMGNIGTQFITEKLIYDLMAGVKLDNYARIREISVMLGIRERISDIEYLLSARRTSGARDTNNRTVLNGGGLSKKTYSSFDSWEATFEVRKHFNPPGDRLWGIWK